MRKVLLCLFVLTGTVICSQAQIKKGSVFLGGDISGSSSTTKNDGNQAKDKNKGVSFSPVVGKFIKDNLVVGGNLSFGYAELSNDLSNYAIKNNSYGVGVFVRKYRNIGNGGFYVFLQGGLGGNYQHNKTGASSGNYVEKTKRTTITASAYPGLSYAVSRRFHLETGFSNLLAIGYFNEKREVPNGIQGVTTYKTNGFNISSSLNNMNSAFYLGFRVLLSKS